MADRFWISTSTTDYNDTAGWSSADTPDAGDVVYLQRNKVAIAASLDQSLIALNGFVQYDSYSGAIGVAYPGYGALPTYLQIDTPSLILGRRDNQDVAMPGSPQIFIDLGTAQACTTTVESTAATSANAAWGLPPVCLKGVDALHALYVKRGSVGVACARADEVSTFVTIETGTPGDFTNSTRLLLGAGVTLTTLNVNSGIARIFNAPTNSYVYGGELRGGGTAGAYTTYVSSMTAGSAVITLRNLTAGSLGEAVILNFAIVHGQS